ncbi:MAG TPA: BPSS1780 family membrane protein [Xanthomonadaceae bacterium]|jgi:hypothetical protein|nr:BPSS1780 family membrane protein [Xanthomonadaceae bacterium]
MDFRIARAGRGLGWFQGAVRMLDRNPRGLLAITLIYFLIPTVPQLLGDVPILSYAVLGLLLPLYPALVAGLLYAIGEADAGRPVSSLQLFEGLRRPGVRGQLLLLGVVQAFALLLVLLAIQRMFGADNLAILKQLINQKLAPDSAEAQRMAGPLVQTMMVVALIQFVLLSGMFFAVPRVMFDGRGALGAFAESIAACAANVLSLTVYGLVLIAVAMLLGVAMVVVAALLSLLGKIGALLMMGVMIAAIVVWVFVSAAGNYLAWRELFGHASSVPPAGIVV